MFKCSGAKSSSKARFFRRADRAAGVLAALPLQAQSFNLVLAAATCIADPPNGKKELLINNNGDFQPDLRAESRKTDSDGLSPMPERICSI